MQGQWYALQTSFNLDIEHFTLEYLVECGHHIKLTKLCLATVLIIWSHLRMLIWADDTSNEYCI